MIRIPDPENEPTRISIMPKVTHSATSGHLRANPTHARENEITGTIIEAAIGIHRALGPGLLESVYAAILVYELRKRGLRVDTEVPIPVIWESVRVECGFRADLIVENLIVVELKSIDEVARVHKKKLLTYLRLTDKRVGLLINFGNELLKDGIERLVNGFVENRDELSL
jgi:GxxExxY protein